MRSSLSGCKHVDAAAREQRRDDFERRILGGCADQANGAALDVGQKGVLLGLVEAVNLIDEEDGARMHLGGLRGGDHHLLDLLDAAHDGGELDEAGLGGFGNDLGQGGFAHAGRTPEDHGAGIVALDLHAQGLAGAEQVLLAAVLLQGARTHPLGQRRGAEGALRALRARRRKGSSLAPPRNGCGSLAGRFVEQHAGRDRGIQAFHGAGAGNRDRAVGLGGEVRRHAIAFIADEECHGAVQIHHIGGRCPSESGGENPHAGLAQAGKTFIRGGRKQRDPEDAARRGADRLGIPGADGSGKAEDAVGAKGLGGAKDRAQIAGVLQSGENHDQGDRLSMAAQQVCPGPIGRLE